ncbi:MAG: lactonase family protein, partial [Candidatus Acidiferrales bacterium]
MYIYVPNGSTSGGVGIISAFKVDPTTGALTPVPGSPFQAGSFVSALVADPAGRFVYVSGNQSYVSGLWVFSVDPVTGSLTPVYGSPFPGPGHGLAIDPTGRFLYADNPNTPNSKALEAYSIDPVSGVPTPILGSPFSAPAAFPLVTDAEGNSFYYFVSSQGGLSTDSIDFETGTPTNVTITSYSENYNVIPWFAVDPLDRFVAVNGTSIFEIDAANGRLFAPGPVVQNSGVSVFDASGRFLYAYVAECSTSCGPSAFQVDPTTGALTPITGSNFSTTAFLSMIADPLDRYIYAVGNNPGGQGTALFAYSMDPSTGALTPVPGTPLPMSYAGNFNSPMAITFAPTGMDNPVPTITTLSP